MVTSFDSFLSWEGTTRDTIDFKRIYVDMAGDLVAGLLLSQLVYWHLDGRDGRTKLRVFRDGHGWVAKQRDDWWDEVRITPKQFDRACKILVDKGLITKTYFRFAGLRTMHLRIVKDRFMEVWQTTLDNPPDNPYKQRVKPVLTKGKDRSIPKGKAGVDERVRPLTESTAENTTETTASRETDFLSLMFPSGSHEGQTLQQVLETDPGYLRWAADNWGSDTIRQAARRVLGDLSEPGRWTEAELETARAESLAETPIDVDAFFEND